MISKTNIYILGTIASIIITCYLSIYDGCVVNYGAPDVPERAEVCSTFIDLYKFYNMFPWMLLAILIPMTAVIFYLSGKKKKHSITLTPGKSDSSKNGGSK